MGEVFKLFAEVGLAMLTSISGLLSPVPIVNTPKPQVENINPNTIQAIPAPTTFILEEPKTGNLQQNKQTTENCTTKHLGTITTPIGQCAKTVECEIGDKWYLYDSNEKCNQDREKYNSAYEYTYVPPLPAPKYIPPAPPIVTNTFVPKTVLQPMPEIHYSGFASPCPSGQIRDMRGNCSAPDVYPQGYLGGY